MRKWLTRFFPVEQFNGKAEGLQFVNGQFRGTSFPGCKALTRWTLIYLKYLKVYLHCWDGDDWTKDLHDHSSRMISIGLKGSYIDITADGARCYLAPWVRTFPASHTHRIVVVEPPVWTLVIAGKQTNHSAFIVNGARVHPDAYVRSKRAVAQRAC